MKTYFLLTFPLVARQTHRELDKELLVIKKTVHQGNIVLDIWMRDSQQMSLGKSFDQKKGLRNRAAAKVQRYSSNSCNAAGESKVISSQNTREELFQTHNWNRKKSQILDWKRNFSLHQGEILVLWKRIKKNSINFRMA